jgi:hypothetical protein
MQVVVLLFTCWPILQYAEWATNVIFIALWYSMMFLLCFDRTNNRSSDLLKDLHWEIETAMSDFCSCIIFFVQCLLPSVYVNVTLQILKPLKLHKCYLVCYVASIILFCCSINFAFLWTLQNLKPLILMCPVLFSPLGFWISGSDLFASWSTTDSYCQSRP